MDIDTTKDPIKVDTPYIDATYELNMNDSTAQDNEDRSSVASVTSCSSCGTPPLRPNGDSFEIPNFTQQKMHKIPRILYLISSYAASYSVITATPNSQLDCANSLFHTLLTHYFPRDQGFQVQKWEPCKYDWSIELKSRTKDPKARAKEQPIFHRVPRENIGGFVVEKMHFVPRDNSHKDEEWIPHTFLAIMIDNLSTKPTWSTTALVQPRDILVPAFSLPPSIYNSNSPTQTSLSTPAPHTPILSAPAFLVLGPQIEFYTFDLHAERESDMCASVKPHRGHVIRICAENKIALGQMFEWVAGWEVRYEDGRVGEGARKWV